jgi:hypothetical protein
MVAMDYLGVSFQLLTFERGYAFSKSMYHYMYILIFVLLVIFRVGKIPQRAAKLEAKLKEKAAASTTSLGPKKDQ